MAGGNNRENFIWEVWNLMAHLMLALPLEPPPASHHPAISRSIKRRSCSSSLWLALSVLEQKKS